MEAEGPVPSFPGNLLASFRNADQAHTRPRMSLLPLSGLHGHTLTHTRSFKTCRHPRLSLDPRRGRDQREYSPKLRVSQPRFMMGRVSSFQEAPSLPPLRLPSPPPDSPSLTRSVKEILCSEDVRSLLGRTRTQHKGSEKVKWGVWGGREGGGNRGRRRFSVSKRELKCFYWSGRNQLKNGPGTKAEKTVDKPC